MEELNCFIAIKQFKNRHVVSMVMPTWGYGSRVKTDAECPVSEGCVQAIYDLLAGLSQVSSLVQKYQKINVYISDLKAYAWLIADAPPTFKLEKTFRMLEEMSSVKSIHRVPYEIKFLSSVQNIAQLPMHLIPFKALTSQEKDEIINGFHTPKS